MTDVRPIFERELLIPDDVRSDLHRKINPLISDVLASRGYSEERSPSNRIYTKNSSDIIVSTASTLYLVNPFDGLSISTTSNIQENEASLVGAAVTLTRIGGFSISKLIKNGENFGIKTIKPGEDEQSNPLVRINQSAVENILHDIRAHTVLGYDASDVLSSSSQAIEELESLHTSRTVDRRAHYEVLTDPEHGDIQMNVGETFELRNIDANDHNLKKRFNTRKFFELLARQPLDGGSVLLGVHYRSSQNDSEVKLTAVIEGTDYTEQRKQEFYQEAVDSFQERDINKFSRGVMNNLNKIIDTDSEIVRLG